MDPDELKSGYEDGTFWPPSVPIESYLLEALDEVRSGTPA